MNVFEFEAEALGDASPLAWPLHDVEETYDGVECTKKMTMLHHCSPLLFHIFSVVFSPRHVVGKFPSSLTWSCQRRHVVGFCLGGEATCAKTAGRKKFQQTPHLNHLPNGLVAA